jgi:hypothetical protein
MGTSNQRRRAEKQRRRNHRREDRDRHAPRTDAAHEGAWRGQASVEYLIQAVAEAVALEKPDADVMIDQLAADARVIGPLNDLIAHHWSGAQARGWSAEIGQHAVRRLGAKHAAWFDTHLVTEARTGIELLALVMTLDPLPGASAAKLDPDDGRMLGRVRALLTKAESTEYAEEAEALTAKAQSLISRHSLQHALEHAARREVPGARHILLDDPYADAKALLVGVIATANRCRAVHLREHGLATVLGFESDLYATEMLFTSLLVQATKAMTASGTAPTRRQPSYRRSFPGGLLDPDRRTSRYGRQRRRWRGRRSSPAAGASRPTQRGRRCRRRSVSSSCPRERTRDQPPRRLHALAGSDVFRRAESVPARKLRWAVAHPVRA